MNYLAHIHLARHSANAMVGAMLGDFAKADVSGKFPPEVALEIQLHRNIDSYTDSHPAVRAALDHFAGPRRRFAGMVLDVYYDHVLSLSWERYCTEARADLIARFYRALAAQQALWPERLARIAPHIIAHDWLGSYVEYENVEFALSRMSQRLSRNGHLMLACLDDLREHRLALTDSFHVFYPDLMAYAQMRRHELKLNDQASGAQE